MKNRYPKWIYASGDRSTIVNNPDEHLKAGPGWYESPAEVAAHEAAAKAPPAVEPAARVPETVASIARSAEAAMRKYYASPVRIIVEQVAALDSREALEEVREIEGNRPGGPRKTVLNAVADRLAALEAPKEGADQS